MRFVPLTANPLVSLADLREGSLTGWRAFALASLRSEPRVLPPGGTLRTGLETNAKAGWNAAPDVSPCLQRRKEKAALSVSRRFAEQWPAAASGIVGKRCFTCTLASFATPFPLDL